MSLTPFSSHLIADVGISTGDEGKGRLIAEIVEELRASTKLDAPVHMVLKVNGGANSGHTAGGVKLNLLLQQRKGDPCQLATEGHERRRGANDLLYD